MEKYKPSEEELANIMKKSEILLKRARELLLKSIKTNCRIIDFKRNKCKETLENSEKTRAKLRETEKASDEFEKKWQDFQDKFSETLSALATNIGSSIGKSVGGVFKKPEYEPKKMSPEDASELLKDKRNIIILTGAGLSAASGIPTFRGNDGLWTKKYKYCETPEELATLKFFKAHPEVKWQWTHDFYDLCKNAEPNAGHKAIVQFQEHCKLNGKQCHLVTQNIDDLHARLIQESKILKPTVTSEGEPGFGFTDFVYEIHGNLSYSRCFQECSKTLKPVQVPDKELSLEDQIPKCEECKSIMRPHVLWFDECYTQELHQAETVKNIITADVDALIIVGTALATNMASRLVSNCLLKNILTIDINIDPACDYGAVVEVEGKSEETLPKLFASFKPKILKCESNGKEVDKNICSKELKKNPKVYPTKLRKIAIAAKSGKTKSGKNKKVTSKA